MSGKFIRKHRKVLDFTHSLQYCIINATQFFNDTVREMFYGSEC